MRVYACTCVYAYVRSECLHVNSCQLVCMYTLKIIYLIRIKELNNICLSFIKYLCHTYKENYSYLLEIKRMLILQNFFLCEIYHIYCVSRTHTCMHVC